MTFTAWKAEELIMKTKKRENFKVKAPGGFERSFSRAVSIDYGVREG